MDLEQARYNLETKLVTCTAVVLLLILIFVPYMRITNKEAADKYEIALEEDYAAYLDGQEIDINKVDASNYIITIDEDNKSLYLTKKGFLDIGQNIKIQ